MISKLWLKLVGGFAFLIIITGLIFYIIIIILTKHFYQHMVHQTDQTRAEVLPGQSFLVEIYLEQQWKRERILSLSGECGYLRLDVMYKGEQVELFQSI